MNHFLLRVLNVCAAAGWWALRGAGWADRLSDVVLCYHSVKPGDAAGFRRQMRLVASRAIDVDRLGAPLRKAASLPRVCVTFDDAFASLCNHVIPIAEEFGIPLMIFVPTGHLGRCPGWTMPAGHRDRDERIMTDKEIQRLARHPLCRFGAHSVSHRNLTKLPPEDLHDELRQSKAVVEQLSRRTVKDVAVPYGCYNDAVLQAARSAGFNRVHTLDGFVRPGHLDVGRVLVPVHAGPAEFFLITRGGYAWRALWKRRGRSHVRSPDAEPAGKTTGAAPEEPGVPGAISRTLERRSCS